MYVNRSSFLTARLLFSFWTTVRLYMNLLFVSKHALTCLSPSINLCVFLCNVLKPPLAQISKWSIRKDICTITLHYSKSHYNGEFKFIRLRSNVKEDSEVLNTLVRILEFHIAQLVVHKGSSQWSIPHATLIRSFLWDLHESSCYSLDTSHSLSICILFTHSWSYCYLCLIPSLPPM